VLTVIEAPAAVIPSAGWHEVAIFATARRRVLNGLNLAALTGRHGRIVGSCR
jgi:hypothetical protein